MNNTLARTVGMAAAAAAFAGSAWLGTAIAHAAPVGVDAYAYENTINLTDLPEIDTIPTCALEDGSDVIPAIAGRCLWTNPDVKGDVWLTYADRSYQIVDDTVTDAQGNPVPHAHGVAAADGGVPGPEMGR